MTKKYIVDQQNSGLQEGDQVKLLNVVNNNEKGWGNIWIEEMTLNVNKIGSILSLNEYKPSLGITVKFDNDEEFDYPYFVLEKVEIKNN